MRDSDLLHRFPAPPGYRDVGRAAGHSGSRAAGRFKLLQRGVGRFDDSGADERHHGTGTRN